MLEVAIGNSRNKVKETYENKAQKAEITFTTQCFQRLPFNEPTKEETTVRGLSDKGKMSIL